MRRLTSKFQVNCALFDTSMKFGTLRVAINTSFFRYSAKPKKRQFLLKSMKFREMFVCPGLWTSTVMSSSDTKLHVQNLE